MQYTLEHGFGFGLSLYVPAMSCPVSNWWVTGVHKILQKVASPNVDRSTCLYGVRNVGSYRGGSCQGLSIPQPEARPSERTKGCTMGALTAKL